MYNRAEQMCQATAVQFFQASIIILRRPHHQQCHVVPCKGPSTLVPILANRMNLHDFALKCLGQNLKHRQIVFVPAIVIRARIKDNRLVVLVAVH